jgi:hypothetical protein
MRPDRNFLEGDCMPNARRSIPAALTLFFVAPLVAEYLLGDFPLTWLPLLLLLAPMYGGGALLIRELVRRSGRGWPSILLLGCAYCLIEEAFTTQSLFNPHYLGMHLLGPAWVPSLGIGGWWTLFMLNVHPFWSIGVSIALTEGLFPARIPTPWLGKVGLCVAAALFAVGIVSNTYYSLRHDPFRASAAQLLVAALLVIVFAGAAFFLPASAASRKPGAAPSPWLSGAAAFLLGFAVFLAPVIPAILIAMRRGAKDRMNFFDASNANLGWAAVAWILAIDLVFLSLLWLCSRLSGWTPLHTFSIGAGGALVYGVHAFLTRPVVPSPRPVVLLSHALFLVLAVVLIAVAARRTQSALAAASSAHAVAGD